jgi:thiamine pyrophosphokinase
MVMTGLKGDGVSETGFMRHVHACQTARLPGERLPFRIGDSHVGWVLPAFAAVLAAEPEIAAGAESVTLAEPARLHDLARRLSDHFHYRWRGEAFDIRATPDGPVLGHLDRGALPSFGVSATGVHVNGLVHRADGLHLWIARRAMDKLLDPGKLDHITAGGVPAGLTPWQTLLKEAAEEASIPAELATAATPVSVIAYAMERPEGLRRDRLCCYDLVLPEWFTPAANDGEVAGFELWPIGRVMEAVHATDDFKFNVTVVLIDLFIRLGLIGGTEAATLRTAIAEGAG